MMSKCQSLCNNPMLRQFLQLLNCCRMLWYGVCSLTLSQWWLISLVPDLLVLSCQLIGCVYTGSVILIWLVKRPIIVGPGCWFWLMSLSQGYSNLTLQGPEYYWFSVLPDHSLHPPGIPGLNQSLIKGEEWKKQWNWLQGPDLNLRILEYIVSKQIFACELWELHGDATTLDGSLWYHRSLWRCLVAELGLSIFSWGVFISAQRSKTTENVFLQRNQRACIGQM